MLQGSILQYFQPSLSYNVFKIFLVYFEWPLKTDMTVDPYFVYLSSKGSGEPALLCTACQRFFLLDNVVVPKYQVLAYIIEPRHKISNNVAF